jgi:chromosome segregation ATPase
VPSPPLTWHLPSHPLLVQLEALHTQLANAHNDMKAARAEALQRDRDLASMELVRDQLNLELDAVTENRDSLVAELEEVESVRGVLETAMESARAANEAKEGEMKDEIAALGSKLQTTEAARNSVSQQLAGELGKRAQQDRLVADLHSDVEALTTSLVESKAAQDVLENKVNQLGVIRNQVFEELQQVCIELEAAQQMAFQAEQENVKHTLEMAVISATLEMRTAERNELEALLKNPQIDDSKEKELAVQLQAAGVCVRVCVCACVSERERLCVSVERRFEFELRQIPRVCF